jgi:hypothetical protein
MSRKYGQRGYMEGERREGGRSPGAGAGAARREPPPPRHNLDRPGGRGLGAPSEQVFRCAVCGNTQPPPDPGALDARCASCGADLHSCTHCIHFDTAARWECRRHAERTAPVLKKARQNDCALMEPRVSVEHATEKRAEPDDPRAAFDALFK